MPNTSHLYSLRRGLGLWQLTFGGRSTVLKHEQGILYVAYLLYHPPLEPIHALDLVARVQGFDSAFGGTLVPTSSGALIVPDKCARFVEKNRNSKRCWTIMKPPNRSTPKPGGNWRQSKTINAKARNAAPTQPAEPSVPCAWRWADFIDV